MQRIEEGGGERCADRELERSGRMEGGRERGGRERKGAGKGVGKGKGWTENGLRRGMERRRDGDGCSQRGVRDEGGGHRARGGREKD